MAGKRNLHIQGGEVYAHPIAFRDENGAPWDTSTWTDLAADIRRWPGKNAPLIQTISIDTTSLAATGSAGASAVLILTETQADQVAAYCSVDRPGYWNLRLRPGDTYLLEGEVTAAPGITD